MSVERNADRLIGLPRSEEIKIFLKIKNISSVNITKDKPGSFLSEFIDVIDFLDPKLRVAGQEYEDGTHHVLGIGEYVVRKTKTGENYSLLITDFLDYNPSDVDNLYLKIPSIRIIYNIDSKKIERIDKMTCDGKGRHYTSYVPKK